MESLTAIGLILGTFAFLLVLYAVRMARVSCVGVIFIAVAFTYHVVGELTQGAFSGRDLYRGYVSSAQVSRWMVVVGAAMLVYAVTYVGSLSFATQHRHYTPLVESSGWPRWSLLLWLSLPLLAVAIGVTTLTGTQVLYWGDGIVTQYLVLVGAMAVFLYVRQSKRPHVVTAFLIQALALSLIGARLSVVAGVVMVLFALALVGRRIGSRSTITIIAVLVIAAVTVSAARGTVGRAALTEADVTERLSGLQSGITSLGSSSPRSLLDDFVYRIDGNAYGAAIMARESNRGAAPLIGIVYAAESVIPSFLRREKLETAVYERNEETFWDLHFNIPTAGVTRQPGPDWLPTMFGGAYAYGLTGGLLLFAAFLGVALALTDRRLHRRISFGSVLVGMGLVWSIVLYERGFQNVLLTMRGVIVAWVIVKAVEGVRIVTMRALKNQVSHHLAS